MSDEDDSYIILESAPIPLGYRISAEGDPWADAPVIHTYIEERNQPPFDGTKERCLIKVYQIPYSLYREVTGHHNWVVEEGNDG